MYRCSQCHDVVGPRQPQRLVVVATRAKRYPPRENAFEVFKSVKRRHVQVDDPGGVGREIVREAALCGDCLKRHR